MIKASIIIPTYNRGKLLCNTLRNLIGQLPTDAEIVVVDQSDEVCSELMEIAKNHSTQIHYYKIFVKGLPHARNYGLKRAIGEIIIFCDDNVIPSCNFIENHVQGCNMSFRKEALIKAGGFDERFGGSAHLEETDLCLRIRRGGYKIVFDPKAELIHLKDTKGGCRAENYKQWFYWYGHNNMLFFLKNFSRSLLPVFIVSSFIRLLLSACKRGNPLIVVWGISGYRAGLADYKSNSTKQ